MKKLMHRAQAELTTIWQSARDLVANKSGATMIEYSVLIGLITVLVIAAVVAIGIWIGGQWTALQTALGA